MQVWENHKYIIIEEKCSFLDVLFVPVLKDSLEDLNVSFFSLDDAISYVKQFTD